MLNTLNNAKLALESDDQAIIDQALATLQDTLDNLKEIPVIELDYSELDERIETYSKLDFKLYTVESASVLQALIEEAKILSSNNPKAKQIITQDDIDMLVEMMDLAYEALELVGEVEPETGLPGTGVNSPYGIGLTVLAAGLAVIMISKVKRKKFE